MAGFNCLNQGDFAKLVKAILTTYVRYSLVCNKNSLDIETKFYQASRDMRRGNQLGETSAKLLASARTTLKDLAVPNAEVHSSAKSLDLERSQAQWLLTQLANAMQSKTKELAMANCNLEHILPVKPGSDWGDVSDMAHLTWRIGNLTILSERINSAAQNKCFIQKKERYYATSEVKMTAALCQIEKWDKAEIEKRSENLGEEIARLWPALQ